MTNPGDSDEWWKQYGGQGVSAESGGHTQVPQPPAPPQGYSSGPQQLPHPMTPPPQQHQAPPPVPPQPQYPSYPQASYPQQFAQVPQPYGPTGPGYPGYPGGGYQPYQPQQQGTSGLAIAALVVSLIGLVSCGLFIGSIVGLVLGVIANNQIRQSGRPGRGLALSGIWISVAGIVIALIYWVVIIIDINKG